MLQYSPNGASLGTSGGQLQMTSLGQLAWGPGSSALATFDASGLTASQVITVPNASGTLALVTPPTSGSATIDFAPIADGNCSSSTFSVVGVVAGQALVPGWPSDLEAGLIGVMRASATNTVEVRLCNLTGVLVDPASHVFTATAANGGSAGSAVYPTGTGVPQVVGGASWGTTLGVGTAANNLVQLTAAAKLPAVDGSLLTNLPSSATTVKVNGTAVGTRPNINFAAGTNISLTGSDNGTDTVTLTVNEAPIIGTYATLPACSPTIEGFRQTVTDSNTNTWGATVAAGGAYRIGAYCDGTNWTVYSK
jgi:hypothetical protein